MSLAVPIADTELIDYFLVKKPKTNDVAENGRSIYSQSACHIELKPGFMFGNSLP
jgi:hypothetical protein